MDNKINQVIGKNLMRLRKNAKLTQMELAEKFNYSDKSISKWESGDSMPSIEVLHELSKFYNVSLDDLAKEEFSPVQAKPVQENVKKNAFPRHLIITLLSVSAVWLVATILFVTLKIVRHVNIYMLFFWAIPASCIVLIVFNSIWGKMYLLFPILTVLLWSVLCGVHVQILLCSTINPWPVYLLGIPLQIAIILWAALIKKPKQKKPKQKEEQNSKN